MSSIILQSNALITSESASVTFTSCTFSEVTESENGEGALIEVSAGEGKTVTIGNNVSFSDCTPSSEHHVMSLTLSSSAKLFIDDVMFSNSYAQGTAVLYLSLSSYTLAEDSFSCSDVVMFSSINAEDTPYIFLESDTKDLLTHLISALKTMIGEYDDSTVNRYQLQQMEDETVSLVVILMHILNPPEDNEEPSYITSSTQTGYSYPTCGWADLPCESMSQLTSRSGPDSVVLNSSSAYTTDRLTAAFTADDFSDCSFTTDGKSSSLILITA